MGKELRSFGAAIDDFRSARNRAMFKEVLGKVRGESVGLLNFDEVRRQLKTQGMVSRGLQDIPLDAIIGSVGRYTDFTRDFLPKGSTDKDRWARIQVAATGMIGLPPIEVYQIGEVYFVKDGHHRVSVARQLKATHIQAYVTQVKTRVPLTPDVHPDDLILKAEQADFLEKTRLDELRPGSDLTLTEPGSYESLAEHISVHRYFMGIEQDRAIGYGEAAVHWYDTVYLPVIQVIREHGILRFFPYRTETDLYLWIMDHRAALERDLGLEVHTEEAAEDLAVHQGSQEKSFFSRITKKLKDILSLDKLEEGPMPGTWRQAKAGDRRSDRLFQEILVPVDGGENAWLALDEALLIADREGARIHGLFVLDTAAEEGSPQAQLLKSEFNLRCSRAGIPGELRFAVGEISRQICFRARWMDLIVAPLNYPPADQPISRLSSGFHDLIHRCPSPILTVPKMSTPLKKALLAFDGSPKAEEALFISTYLAGQWQMQLQVISVLGDAGVTEQTIQKAHRYLEDHGISADYVTKAGPVADTILQTSAACECDLLIMGGYGSKPVREVMLGSVVDQVLRVYRKPVLVCR